MCVSTRKPRKDVGGAATLTGFRIPADNIMQPVFSLGLVSPSQ